MSSISIVVPLFAAERHLDRVLPPLLAALAAREVLEVIVVDDGSHDRGPELCRAHAVRVLDSGGRKGPGGARNVGVQAAAGDIILFIDSDVVMSTDVPARMRAVFDSDPGVVAVFGSYDDAPAARNVVSLYKNLLHHFVHHRARREASTFWAGCGAVRREAFLAAGGFDATRYPQPSIEDIELAHRLRARGGRIVLDPAISCKHLKRWSLLSLITTDVFQRALPWARLLQHPGASGDDLNLKFSERVRALVAIALPVALGLSWVWPSLAWLALALGAGAFLANTRFFRLVRHSGGARAMLAAVVLHQLYYVYSSLTFVYAWVEAKATGPR